MSQEGCMLFMNYNYKNIPENLILNYELLKIAIYEENKSLFEDRPYILEKWKHEAYHMTEKEVYQVLDQEMSSSFRALFSLFTQTLYSEQPITKKMVQDAVIYYKDTIKVILSGHFINEFPSDEIKRSLNEEKITEALKSDYLYSSMDIDYHLMRDIVTKKKDFKESEDGLLSTEIIDNHGKVRGYAELRPQQWTSTVTPDQSIWLELIESTINSLDEMTADIFDLITYLWIVSPKSDDGFIEFHCNDALRLRHLKKRTSHGREIDYRQEDRFNIMKRVAALSSIWVYLGDKHIKVVNTQDIKDHENFNFKDFQRMFEIGKIRVAYDKKTGETQGIYAVQVKPTSILTPYLDGPNRSLGLLDVKVFQYSHHTQREHKRLIRYLNLQWKIRTLKHTLHQPFKVSTLLKVMDMSSRYNGVQKRDRFENILDELQKDKVIEKWEYNERLDEEKVGKKGWFTNYWTKLNVTVLPPDIVIQENKKKLILNANTTFNKDITELMNQQKKSTPVIELTPGNKDKSEQQCFDFEEKKEIILSPEIMKKTIEFLNMSIRQAALEIGVAHTTLSRYLKKENTRQNCKNDEKMLTWLKKQVLTNV